MGTTAYLGPPDAGHHNEHGAGHSLGPGHQPHLGDGQEVPQVQASRSSNGKDWFTVQCTKSILLEGCHRLDLLLHVLLQPECGADRVPCYLQAQPGAGHTA